LVYLRCYLCSIHKRRNCL